jgi:Icc-related predicted phosphoesterase
MKGLLVSDIHYRLKQLDWLISVAPDFDLVVIAGDHLDVASPVAVDAQVVVTLKYLQRLRAAAPLVVSSGNHDLVGRNGAGEKMATWMSKVRRLGIASDGQSLLLDDTLVTVCPWWDGPSAREEVARQLASDAPRRPARWIWVYHAPPAGSPTSWNGTRHYGDVELAGWIAAYRPDLVLCGHIHQSPFRSGGSWIDRVGDSWVLNAGCQIGPIPAHVVFDTDACEANWFSLAGSERARLDVTEPKREPLGE